MEIYLDKVRVDRVQDPGLTPIGEFLPRSAPLVDYLAIGLHSAAGMEVSVCSDDYPWNPSLPWSILSDAERCRSERDNCRKIKK